MKKSVRELVAATMGKPPGALPDIQSFPPLDADQVARELRLDERAEKAAMAGQPAADADGPDSAELDVLGKIEGYARKAREDYLSQRDLYETRIQRSGITPDLQIQIEAAASNALVDFKAEVLHEQNSSTPCSGWWQTGRASFGSSASGTSSTAFPSISPGVSESWGIAADRVRAAGIDHQRDVLRRGERGGDHRRRDAGAGAVGVERGRRLPCMRCTACRSCFTAGGASSSSAGC